jgi:uncharacterized protein
MQRFVLCVASTLFLIVVHASLAADALPPAPQNFFNDYAGVTRPATREQLESSLAALDRDTSVQIVVAVFKKLPEGAALEDFTQRTAASWKVGRKKLDNGAVLFVFTEDRKMRIEVGYGLEGAIPDALAKRILAEEIRPRFQQGDFDGGITAGVNALMKAARGEYKSTGKSIALGQPWPLYVFLALFLLIALSSFRRGRRGTTFSRRGRSHGGFWPVVVSSGGWSGGGGGWSSGGGGGFSGGGGDFGGGGASDSW